MDRFSRIIVAVKNVLRDSAVAWDQFWFTPSNATALGWLRILSGCMLVYTHAVWGLRLDAFFGPEGWQDPLLVRVFLERSAAASFWWYVPLDWMTTVHASSLAILVLYVLGAGLRFTAPLALVIVLSYANRAPQANFGLDQINTLLTAYICIGYLFLPRRDACLSLDRAWYRFRSLWKAARSGDLSPGVDTPQPHVAVNIAVRLVQIHMALIYLYAGLGKLKGDAWWDGTAVWMAAANFEYQSGDLTWIAWHPYVSQIATMATVAWEVTFVLLVWRPRWQPWVLLCGVLMHLGIGAFLGMWTFGSIMIVTYLSFISPETLIRLQAGCTVLCGRDRPSKVRFDPESRLSCLHAAWAGIWAEDDALGWNLVVDDSAVSEPRRTIRVTESVRFGILLGMFAVIPVSGCRPAANSARVLHERSRLLTADGKLEEAISLLTDALAQDPANADLYYDRARLEELCDRNSQALADYDRAIDIQPLYARAHNNRGVVLLKQHHVEEAIAGFTRAMELDPRDVMACRNRAQAYGQIGDLSSALADFERAAELVPGSVDPWMERGELCLAANALEEAERSYTMAIRLHPQLAAAWRKRSEVRRKLGKTAQAEADAARAQLIEPALAEMPVEQVIEKPADVIETIEAGSAAEP